MREGENSEVGENLHEQVL